MSSFVLSKCLRLSSASSAFFSTSRSLSLASAPSTVLLFNELPRNRKCDNERIKFSRMQDIQDRFYSSGGKSLADEIMAAKKEQEKAKNESGSEKSGGEGEAKSEGPKPLTKWQKRGYIFFGVWMTGTLISYAVIFSLPDKDEDGNTVEDSFSGQGFMQYPRRLRHKMFQTKKEIEEPFSDKLLPDPLPEPYIQPKYTILLELTGLLVHSNWTHKHGWRFQKRPGVDMLLSQIGYPEFELVLFTVENPMTFVPVVEQLDPNNQYIMYKLFRDATRYVNGSHTKDLSALNRDLRKVIVVDWNKATTALNSENSLILKKWEGDTQDRTLIGLAQFLQAIKETDVDDVRDVLQFYGQFEDPIEAFRENQRKLQNELEAEEERKKQLAAQGGKKGSYMPGSSLISNLTGYGRR